MSDSHSPSDRHLQDARSATTRPAFEPGEDVAGEVERRKAQGLLALSRRDYRTAVEWLEQALVGVNSEAERAAILAALMQALRGVAEESAGPLAGRIYRRARRILKLALPLARQHEEVLAHTLREAACQAAERGRRERCRQLLAESLAVAERLGQDREAARTHLERGSLGCLWGWPEASQERQLARAVLRQLEPEGPGERAGPDLGRAPLEELVDWSCRLASVQSPTLQLLEEALAGLLPASRVEVLPRPDPNHPLMRQVAERGHVLVGTESERVLLGAPVLVDGDLRHLVQAERGLHQGPFDTRCVLLAQFLSSLAGAALENSRNFQEQDLLVERLHESERYFREVFEGVDVGLALVGSDDQILEANPTLCALLGSPEKGLVGTPFTSYLHPLDRAAEDRRFQDLVGGGSRHYQCEMRFVRQNSPAWAQLTTAPLPGFPQLIVRTLVDVSFARIKALMELEEQERAWLAVDLHDAPAQTAAALCFQLQALQAQEPSPELGEAVRGAEALSTRLRELLSQLSNPVLSGDTLSGALAPLVEVSPEVDQLPNAALIYRLIRDCTDSLQGPFRLDFEHSHDRTRLALEHGGWLSSPGFLSQRCRLLGGEMHTQPGLIHLILPF